LQGQGRVPAISINEPAVEIHVSEEQTARIFDGPPNTPIDPSEPPAEDNGDGSIYEYMVRKFGE
jgi:hypothetical protein